MGRITVHADRDVCIGSENCHHFAPRTFETDDDGLVVVTIDGGDDDDAIRTAVRGCPVGALSMTEEPDEPGEAG